MQDWQTVSVKNYESILGLEDPQNVVLEVDLKKIRKSKSVDTRLIEFISIANENNLNVSLWITNPKSNEDLLAFLNQNPISELAKIEFFIINLQDLEDELSEEIAKKSFIDLSNSSPKNYEKQFNTAAKLNYRGILLDAQIFKRSHIVLAHKFNLDFAISGIIYERHLQAANASETDIKIFG